MPKPDFDFRTKWQKRRDNALGWLFALAIIGAVISGAVWWQIYRWQDCRHVGHAKLYCILTAGR